MVTEKKIAFGLPLAYALVGCVLLSAQAYSAPTISHKTVIEATCFEPVAKGSSGVFQKVYREGKDDVKDISLYTNTLVIKFNVTDERIRKGLPSQIGYSNNGGMPCIIKNILVETDTRG